MNYPSNFWFINKLSANLFVHILSSCLPIGELNWPMIIARPFKQSLRGNLYYWPSMLFTSIVLTYPHSFFFKESSFFLLFGFLLKLVVAHSNDGKDKIDEVEGSQEDDDQEEYDVPGSCCTQHHLVQVLPVILHC